MAFRFPPNRHLFSFDRHNSFFRSLCVFIALIVADIITITLNEYDLQIAIIIPITVKSVLTGFLFIYLLYTLFDLKVDAITRDEARNNVRIYIFMLTLGIVITLSLYLLYFSDLSHFDRQYLHTFVFGVLMSRIFLSINCAILLFIVWYGAASIDKLNVVSNIDFDDFLYQYDVDLCTTVVTLDCICCACQSKLSRDFNHFDEDNYSIRTVNEWRKTCFIISGTSLLSFTLASEMCQFFFPTLWPMHYYSHSLSGKHPTISTNWLIQFCSRKSNSICTNLSVCVIVGWQINYVIHQRQQSIHQIVRETLPQTCPDLFIQHFRQSVSTFLDEMELLPCLTGTKISP